jgi:3-oxoacyl-[acyl-carrier protein] reductase
VRDLSSADRAHHRAAASIAIYPVQYELGSASSAEAAVAAMIEQFGRLDSALLCAGVWAGGRLERADPPVWARVVGCNPIGAAQLCRAALPHLRRGMNPSIVLVSSVSLSARQRIMDRTLLGRFGTPAEIARAAVFLSEGATFCTGTVLNVDGGWST